MEKTELRQVKQVIILRKDLKMRKGKMIAQGAHASMAVIFNMLKFSSQLSTGFIKYILEVAPPISEWISGSFTKIAVSVNSEGELLEIYSQALNAGIPSSLITDSGKTEFHDISTKTAVAIGPWWSDEIDKITGELKLL